MAKNKERIKVMIIKITVIILVYIIGVLFVIALFRGSKGRR